MAKKSRSGNSYKQQYKAYDIEGRWKKNKVAKLQRRLQKNANDIGAETALEKVLNGTYKYSRNRKSKGHVCKVEKLMLVDIPTPPPISNAADQLYKLGLLNEKHYRTFKSRMEGLRRR